MRPAWIEVDCNAITQNIREVKKWIGPKSNVMAIVKANAYGHGAIPVSKAALRGGATMLGVAIIEEGFELRDAGFEVPILVLGATLPKHVDDAVARRIDLTVSSMEVIRAISCAAVKRQIPARIHIKVDTGMGRVGFNPSEIPTVIEEASKLPGIELAGLSTHYATSDCDLEFARRQFLVFDQVCQELRACNLPVPMCHTANSAAIAFMPEAHFEMVRPGLLTYGMAPNEKPFDSISLKPALSLKAQITQIRQMPPDTSISYGRTYFTSKSERIAAIPLGYGDGYFRAHSNKGKVLVKGIKVPIRGRVCMDQLLIDITGIPDVELGEEVVLVGRQGSEELSAWDVAMVANTISYEVTTVLSPRLPRVYCGNDS
jgi:alanine racemase